MFDRLAEKDEMLRPEEEGLVAAASDRRQLIGLGLGVEALYSLHSLPPAGTASWFDGGRPGKH